MNNVTLRQLRYFDALARHLHFGRAAGQCAISQPALSMQIQDLEAEIGTPLVERTRQGAKLTAAGEEVARKIGRILAEVDDLTDYARQSGELLSGRLRLGVIPTIAPYVLPALLPLLRAGYPKLDLHLREAQTQYLVADLAAGRLDALLLSLPIEHPDLETGALFDDEFILAASASGAFRKQSVATLPFLEKDRLLLLEEGHCLREQALSFCALKQLDNLNTLGTSSLSTLVQMVVNGFGVTLLPKMSIPVEARRRALVLIPFEKPKPTRSIGLAWRKSATKKADYAALGELVTSVTQPIHSSSDDIIAENAHRSVLGMDFR